MNNIKWANKFYDVTTKEGLTGFIKSITPYLKYRRDVLCRQYQVVPAAYEDILQEFYIKVIMILPKYNPSKASIKTFIHGALNRYMQDLLKSSGSYNMYTGSDIVDLDVLIHHLEE